MELHIEMSLVILKKKSELNLPIESIFISNIQGIQHKTYFKKVSKFKSQ